MAKQLKSGGNEVRGVSARGALGREPCQGRNSLYGAICAALSHLPKGPAAAGSVTSNSCAKKSCGAGGAGDSPAQSDTAGESPAPPQSQTVQSSLSWRPR